MVEDVEGVGLKFQGEAFPKLEILENRNIESRLEWGAEDVAPVVSIAGFLGITNCRPAESRAAGRNTTLARAQERNGEIVGVDVGNPDSSKRTGFERIVGPTLGSLMWRDSRSQWKNRIGDEVVGAEENASGRSREIDDAEGFAALSHGDTLDAPAVRRFVDESGSIGTSRKLIHVTNRQDVRAIEIGRRVSRPGLKGIVAVEEQAGT